MSIKCLCALAVLVLSAAAPLAQNRLVIDVSKVNRPQSTSGVVHYQGTGSVRHSEQRTYQAAQDRHAVQAAGNRNAEQGAQARRTVSAQGRHEVLRAQGRTYGKATDRHGSVRLDTVR
ncbi:MAG: hypothetical protein E2O65_02570 [Gammaproteobacteria bacterium]|nr:MAG: hypothetical protein E2O65_02570 [Gammaproteobacteria bacterium]